MQCTGTQYDQIGAKAEFFLSISAPHLRNAIGRCFQVTDFALIQQLGGVFFYRGRKANASAVVLAVVGANIPNTFAAAWDIFACHRHGVGMQPFRSKKVVQFLAWPTQGWGGHQRIK